MESEENPEFFLYTLMQPLQGWNIGKKYKPQTTNFWKLLWLHVQEDLANQGIPSWEIGMRLIRDNARKFPGGECAQSVAHSSELETNLRREFESIWFGTLWRHQNGDASVVRHCHQSDSVTSPTVSLVQHHPVLQIQLSIVNVMCEYYLAYLILKTAMR